MLALTYLYQMLATFRHLFSRHTPWVLFCVVILGFIGTPYIEGLTSMCRFWHMEEADYHRLLHFFHSSAWSLGALVSHWSHLVLNKQVTVTAYDRIVLLGDHTAVVKDARRMPGVVTLHQDSETQSKPNYYRGHYWGVVGLLVGSLSDAFCLPLEARLHQGFTHLETDRSSLTERDTQGVMLVQMALDFATRHDLGSILVLDAFFSIAAVFELANSVCSIALKQPYLTILTRAKKSYVASLEPPVPTSPRPGRPRKYGDKIGILQIPVDSFSKSPGSGRMVMQSRIVMIRHQPPPTRGCTMQFTRRPDLDPQTRIDIVKDVWINQGIYGKMTQIAQDYHISRTFLYQLSWAAQHHLEELFGDHPHRAESPHFLIEPWMLMLRLEGNCAIPSISSIFKHFNYQPSSVGYLSEALQDYGRGVPSTLSMPHKKVVFYLSDEIFAIQAPILVTIDGQSTAILKIELAAARSAKTWETHVKALGAHRFHSPGMASDRGVGLKAGYQAACQEGFWVCDQFHEFQDLFQRSHQLERHAYRAIAREHERAETFYHAKSEANLQKRLEQYERAQQTIS